MSKASSLSSSSLLELTSRCTLLHTALKQQEHQRLEWISELIAVAAIFVHEFNDGAKLANEYLSVAEYFLSQLDDGAEKWIAEYKTELIILRLQHILDLMLECQKKHVQRRSVLIKSAADQEKMGENELAEFHFPSELIQKIPIKDFETSYHYATIKEMFMFAMSKIKSNEDVPMLTEQRAEICARLCALYDVLIYFERSYRSPETLGRVAKMQKRKLAACEALLSEMTRFRRTSEEKRSLQFRMAGIWFDLLESKQSQFERTAGDLSPRLLQKMAYICKQGIAACENCLVPTGMAKRDKVLDKDLIKNKEDRVFCFKSWFLIARFNNKFFSPDRKEQMRYTKKAICYYQVFISGVESCPETKDMLKTEMDKAVDTIDILRRQVRKQEEMEQM